MNAKPATNRLKHIDHMAIHFAGRSGHAIFQFLRRTESSKTEIEIFQADLIDSRQRFSLNGSSFRPPTDLANLTRTQSQTTGYAGVFNFYLGIAEELHEHAGMPSSTLDQCPEIGELDMAFIAGRDLVNRLLNFDFAGARNKARSLDEGEGVSPFHRLYVQFIPEPTFDITTTVSSLLEGQLRQITGYDHEDYPGVRRPSQDQKMAVTLGSVALSHKPVATMKRAGSSTIDRAILDFFVEEVGNDIDPTTRLTDQGIETLRGYLADPEIWRDASLEPSF